jgi:hypothetical protein
MVCGYGSSSERSAGTSRHAPQRYRPVPSRSWRRLASILRSSSPRSTSAVCAFTARTCPSYASRPSRVSTAVASFSASSLGMKLSGSSKNTSHHSAVPWSEASPRQRWSWGTGNILVALSHPDGKVETVQPNILIGAGGAHSITRGAMSDPLKGATYGATYEGHFLVADIKMQAPLPRATSRASSAVPMALFSCPRSQAGAGLVPGSGRGDTGSIYRRHRQPHRGPTWCQVPPTGAPGSRRFECIDGSSRVCPTAGGS